MGTDQSGKTSLGSDELGLPFYLMGSQNEQLWVAVEWKLGQRLCQKRI